MKKEMIDDLKRWVNDSFLKQLSKKELLKRLKASTRDADKLILNLMEEAYRQRKPDDVTALLVILCMLGVSPLYFDILCKFAKADWHYDHENVISLLDDLRDPRAIEIFYQSARKKYPYIDGDEARAFAVKAIWALGNLNHPVADEKLRLLSKNKSNIVREAAVYQLQRRQEASKPLFQKLRDRIGTFKDTQ